VPYEVEDDQTMTKLSVGDKAPAFNLPDQHGAKVRLSELKGRKVLMFFYPKADTPGCTTQACAMRDVSGEVGDAVILGVSPDAPERQARFDAKHGLGYPLLSDASHEVAEKYGAWGEKKLYGKTYEGVIRSAFLIDEQGRIAEALYKVSPKDTPTRLLEALSA
jgi:peroxiredoxin Q/BCP